jgi:hypothetical protein
MPQIFDMGQTALLLFFARKNLTASAGSESAILGTRGQHANHQSTEAAFPDGKLHNWILQKKKGCKLIRNVGYYQSLKTASQLSKTPSTPTPIPQILPKTLTLSPTSTHLII